jgi:NAD(P)-dependent dehydrogenase (short-subunit alcohol dehydrogenase family)
MLLAGKKVVISGVGPGLGVELARAAAREGAAAVLLAARQAQYLEKTAAELRGSGARALPVPTDITDAAQCERLAETALRELGQVDALINNAYLFGHHGPFEETRAEHWRAPFEVNLVGTLQVIRALLPALERANGAAVANIGTIGSRRARADEIGYAASKGALLAATRCLALELGPRRIRVNSIPIGWMWGPAVEGGLERMAAARGVTRDEHLAEINERMALGRLADDAECADPVIFMVSDLARGITGAILDVNAGEWMP